MPIWCRANYQERKSVDLFNAHKQIHVLRSRHKSQNAAIWYVQTDPWISTVQANLKRLLSHSKFKGRFQFIFRIAKIFSFQLSLDFFYFVKLSFFNIFKNVTDFSLFLLILLGLCKEITEERMETLKSQRISEVKGCDPSNACWPDPLEVYFKSERTICMPFGFLHSNCFLQKQTWPFILRNK